MNYQANTYGVQGHITSLNPIRPANAPDPWEKRALKAFQNGDEEFSSIEEINDQQTVYLDIIKSNLEDVIAPFLHRLSTKYSDLTPKEIQIAGLVKDGKTTKEIAELLNSSTGAVDFHRNNLRKKLGLRNTKTNLSLN